MHTNITTDSILLICRISNIIKYTWDINVIGLTVETQVYSFFIISHIWSLMSTRTFFLINMGICSISYPIRTVYGCSIHELNFQCLVHQICTQKIIKNYK